MVMATCVLIISSISVLAPLWLLRQHYEQMDLPESITPSQDEAKSNTMSFNSFLNDPEQLELFQQFLRKEFSLENLVVIPKCHNSDNSLFRQFESIKL